MVTTRPIVRPGAARRRSGARYHRAGASVLPPSLCQALGEPAPDNFEPRRIEHVVIVMQENRSFDSYFGTLSGVLGFDDPAAAHHPAGGRSVLHQADPGHPDGCLLPFHLDTAITSAAAAVDPSHVWFAQHAVHDEPGNWVSAHRAFDGDQVGPMAMGYHTRADLPFHYALADEFTVCDRYYCSVLGPTNPNRLYAWTGTIDPQGNNGGPVTGNSATPPYRWTTYPERLEGVGVSWRVYQQRDNYDCNPLAWFAQFQAAPTCSSLYRNGREARSAGAFEQDVRDDRLPEVSWVIAPTAECEHPPNLPAAGAVFIAGCLEALAATPEVWRKTAFILTYDENGGFFDHVSPPVPPSGTADEFVGALPIGLGFRVPTVVISPYSRGGRVCSETFDHTSLLRLCERVFGVEEPNISDWRRDTCGDLTAALDTSQRSWAFPPLPDAHHHLVQQVRSRNLPPPVVPIRQSHPGQEPGTRRRRPAGQEVGREARAGQPLPRGSGKSACT